jgi:hypothetical protein
MILALLACSPTEVVLDDPAFVTFIGDERLATKINNDTLYNFGDLLRSEELCYWERQRLQVVKHLTGENQEIPGCSL